MLFFYYANAIALLSS